MIITIIGSLSRSEEMLEVKNYFEIVLGNKVNCPCDDPIQKMPLIEIQMYWIDKIAEADLIIAIPKEIVSMKTVESTEYDVLFGESTSYEIAIAKKLNKKVVIWSSEDLYKPTECRN